MSKSDVLQSKMKVAIAAESPTDYAGQLVAALSVLHDNLAESLKSQLSDAETGQVYARPYQIAKRWGYTEGGLRRFLYTAEQSGKVRTMTLSDIYGNKGATVYHLGDLERFFKGSQPA